MTPAIEPAPAAVKKLFGSAWQWLVATLKSINNTQTQVNAAFYITGLTIKNNTPDGTDISWSACTVWYNGTPYAVAAGNTTGGALLVWWSVTSPNAFQTGSSFLPAAGTYGVMANQQGTADVLWNKLGAGGVQSGHLGIESALYNGPSGVMFTDVVWTSTPGTGVSWSSGNVWYKGIRYPIASGSIDNTKFWLYWKSSNSGIFQASATYPALGADDFLLGINGSSGNPSQLGNFARVWELRQASGQTVYITADGSIFAYNAEGAEMYALSRSGADGLGSAGYGTLNLFNGTGTRWIYIDGSMGQITTNRAIAGTAGASAGYVDIIVQGGVTYKLQLFGS